MIPVRTDASLVIPGGKTMDELDLIPVDYKELTPELRAEQTTKFYELWDKYRP